MRVVPITLVLLLVLGTYGVSADEDAAANPLQERLRQIEVSLSVENQALGDVLDILRVQTGLNLLIDPRIESDVREVPVTGLFVEDLPLTTVLDMLREVAGEEVLWRPRGNTLVLTHREFVRDAQSVRLYPLAALTTGRTAFVPSSRGLLRGEHTVRDDDRHLPFGSADEIIDLLRGAVSPRYWEETEGADIRTDGEHRLVVKAAPRIHAAIDRFFAGLADMEPDAIQVEIRAARPTEDTDAPDPTLCLAVRPGLASTAFAGTRRAHVARYDTSFAGKASSLDPEVAQLEVGMAAWVRALPDPAGQQVLLQLDVAMAVPGRERAHESRAGAEIALLGREIVRREGVLLVTPGRWHSMEGRMGGGDAGEWGFLVRATPVPSEGGPAETPGAFEVPAPVRGEAARRLADRRITELSWEEASLDQVLVYLRTISGLNFYVTPRLREEVYEDVELTLHLADTSLITVLDLITEPYELTWRAKDDLVTLDVRDHGLEQMHLEYFDVKDLVDPVRPAQIHASPPGGDEDGVEYPERPEPVPVHHVESLVELVRESLGREEAWEDPAMIEARNGILIVRNTRSILDAVDRFLTDLRASRELVVTTVAQIELDDAVARLIVPEQENEGCPLLLGAGHVVALRKAIESGRASYLSRERFVSYEGSGEPRFTGTELPYVADYDVDSRGEASAPVRRVKTLRSGTQLQLRALPVYPGNRIYVEIALERAVLTAMESADTPHGSIDLPRQDVWSVRTGFRVPDGRTAVVSVSRADVNGRWRLLLVRPRRVPFAK